MNRALFRCLAALAFTAILLPQASVRAAGVSQHESVTLQGIVLNDSGRPVPGAFVTANSVSVMADSTGSYHLDLVQPTGPVMVSVWAPGYQGKSVRVTFPESNVPLGAVTLNFTGSFDLTSSFVNPAAGARLEGLPIVTPTSVRTIHFHGVATVALEARIAVTLPSGRVKTYPLHRHGTTFSATLPVRTSGVYRVEINGVTGMAVFNIITFHGVATFMPDEPAFPPDPTGASTAELQRFVVKMLNQVRSEMHLPPVALRKQISGAAGAHSADMARYGYVSHTGRDGSTSFQRVRRVDPHVRRVGETIASASTLGLAVTALVDSPAHRAVILGKYRWVGVGVAPVTGGSLITIDWTR